MTTNPIRSWLAFSFLLVCTATRADDVTITQDDKQIVISTPHLEATIRKEGYVTGVAGGTFLDKKTGAHDLGYGLDIVDWIMEPGSDKAYADKLPDHMVYQYGNDYHGKTAKRSIEGPQICTKAGKIESEVIEGKDFTAVKLWYHYTLAAPGHKTGSKWTQTLVFPHDKRYFISSDRIDAVNSSDSMFFRLDMPGHIKHKQGDTFSEVYLSYKGRIPADKFTENFAPDERYNYRRDKWNRSPDLFESNRKAPQRFIRAYHVRNPETKEDGPWLAGMTLDPSVVHEAWCHQRGYVCMIEEIGGQPVQAGESFGAAFIVGWFDDVDQMHKVYDQHRGMRGLEVSKGRWKLTKEVARESRE